MYSKRGKHSMVMDIKSMDKYFKQKPIRRPVLSTKEAVDYFINCQKKPISDEYMAKLEAQYEPYLKNIRFE